MNKSLTRLILSVLLMLNLGSTAQASETTLKWTQALEEPVRWYIDNEVHLPQYMWFVSDRNKQVRVLAYQTTLVVNCSEAEGVGRRAVEIRCLIEDVALRAASSRAERNRLGPILIEMTEKLRGASVTLRMRTNGRLVQVSFTEARNRRYNRRVNQMHENLRLILYRAFAGLDLELPKKGRSEEGYWMQFDSALFMAPSNSGTIGTAEIIHRQEAENGGVVKIQTSGEGVLTPGDSSNNFYAARLEGYAKFNAGSGLLEERGWMCAGQPTASSAIAQAGLGMPYIQRGILKRIESAAAVNVGASGEVKPNEAVPGLIGTWGTIGAPAGAIRP